MKPSQTHTLITIGHGAYRGANSQRLCASKSEAVEVLRQRGATRDRARRAVNAATAKDRGWATLTVGGDVIEVTNDYSQAVAGRWPSLEYTRAQRERYDGFFKA